MTIIWTHIDDRLVHGQISCKWLQWAKADVCAVVNDDASKNKVAPVVYAMAMPSNVDLDLISIDNFAKKVKNGNYGEKRIFIIIKTPEDVLRIIEKGVKLKQANLGMLTPSPGQKGVVVSPGCWVFPHQVETYDKLNSLGVKLTVRMVPESTERDLVNIINSKVRK